jgi:hypothetical protein
MTRGYASYPSLSWIYLEDSYVLDIVEHPTELRFVLEAVLTPERPQYRPPSAGEPHCHVDRELAFATVSHIKWIDRSSRKYKDATGSADMGNIDSLTDADGVYSVAGDWFGYGVVKIRSSELLNRLQ